MTRSAVTQQTRFLVLIQSKFSEHWTESIFGARDHKTRLIVVHLISALSRFGLLDIHPSKEHQTAGINQMRRTDQTFTARHLGLALWSLGLPTVMHDHDCDLIGPSYSAQLRHEVLLVLQLTAEVDLHKTVKDEHVAPEQNLGVDDELNSLIGTHDVRVVNDEHLLV